jgi:c-di-GMP-binding flagellar brake protein YcgR
VKTRRNLAPEDTIEMFDCAVRDRALAVLSVNEDGQWITFKSRFLERDPKRQFFVLDYQAFDQETLPELLPGRCVGISFRYRNRKVLFSSAVQARGHFVLDPSTSIPAVRYRWPETMTELQRRAYFRTPVPENQILIATLWPNGVGQRPADGGNPHADCVTGQVLDISCGGAFIRLNRAEPPEWPENWTLGAEINLGDNRPPLLVDVRYRGSRRDNFGQVGVAVQFVGLEMTVEGRLILQRLAQSLQRFHRLSLMAGGNAWLKT